MQITLVTWNYCTWQIRARWRLRTCYYPARYMYIAVCRISGNNALNPRSRPSFVIIIRNEYNLSGCDMDTATLTCNVKRNVLHRIITRYEFQMAIHWQKQGGGERRRGFNSLGARGHEAKVGRFRARPIFAKRRASRAMPTWNQFSCRINREQGGPRADSRGL